MIFIGTLFYVKYSLLSVLVAILKEVVLDADVKVVPHFRNMKTKR